MTSSRLTVRPISREEHLGFLRTQRSASFLQTPAWGRVKAEWRPESIGWLAALGPGAAASEQAGGTRQPAGSQLAGSQLAGSELVGVGLVLHRQLPRVKRYLAYLPEGPVIDWADDDLGRWLAPLGKYLASRGAFAVRIGPPVVTRRWTAEAVKRGVADDSVARLTDLPPSERSGVGAGVVSQLQTLGWRQQRVLTGFAAGQPRYNFQVPLTGRSEAQLLEAMNQLWRRNIKKAAKAGVEVTRSSPQTVGVDLQCFHDLYLHTAERDHFTPRPLGYFQTMFDALLGEDADRVRLYLARHDGDLIAATVWVRVGGHTWYAYGASSTAKREVRGSNAVQWAMMRDALAVGADVYDLRGITDTLDPDDPHVGLVQFKVGTGGEAVEYAGEWDLPVNRLVYRGFELYLRRRFKGSGRWA